MLLHWNLQPNETTLPYMLLQPSGVGTVQLSKSIFNFTDTQDVRVSVGCNAVINHRGDIVQVTSNSLQSILQFLGRRTLHACFCFHRLMLCKQSLVTCQCQGGCEVQSLHAPVKVSTRNHGTCTLHLHMHVQLHLKEVCFTKSPMHWYSYCQVAHAFVLIMSRRPCIGTHIFG